MSLLETAIGLLAPPQCINCNEEGSALCRQCSAVAIRPFGERCWRCNSLSLNCRTCPKCRHLGGPHHVWISTDHDNIARDLLSLYKFGHQRVAAEPIARLMSDTFLKFNPFESTAGKEYLIVPIPTATSRSRARGFGHAELLGRYIAANLKQERSDSLRRIGQSRQLGSAREKRLRQLSSSFLVKNPYKIRGRNILIVDDVVTTGGTIISATQTLLSAGAKQVDAILFAKRL
ncbi:MAG TPA: phosphoribosyltransferase family protein [Candidatus Babeliales bacterium]|nr:phosphoribosyltransferase family protein [Candidatus Babeliales bacterium]